MALTTITKLYGVDDCKLIPITEDSSTAFTLGTAIDLPGVRQVSVTFEIDTKDLMGDEKTLETSSKVKSVTVNAEYAKLSLEVLAQITGGSFSADASTGTFSFSGGDMPGYFQLQAQIKDTNNVGGDAHIIVYKAKATSAPINGTQDDFAIMNFDCKGVFTTYEFDGKQKLLDLKVNATETALAGVGSATAGVLTLSSNIAAAGSGGVIGGVLSGVSFLSEAAAETTSNYTFSYGTTGLTIASVTYINAHTVAFLFSGTAAAGTISITPKATVTSNGVAGVAGTYTIS